MPEVAARPADPAGPSPSASCAPSARSATPRIPIAEPPPEHLPDRIDAVLTVLYLVYTEGHTATGGDGLRRDDVAEEAIRLAEVLHGLMPDEAEPTALLALMTLHHARRAARTGADGALVLLADQDRALWDREAIARGTALVERALRMRRPPGRYALEAAIAALHAEAPAAADTDWPQILASTTSCARAAPSPVVDLNRAVALGEVDGPRRGARRRRRAGGRRPARRVRAPARRARRPAAAARPRRGGGRGLRAGGAGWRATRRSGPSWPAGLSAEVGRPGLSGEAVRAHQAHGLARRPSGPSSSSSSSPSPPGGPGRRLRSSMLMWAWPRAVAISEITPGRFGHRHHHPRRRGGPVVLGLAQAGAGRAAALADEAAAASRGRRARAPPRPRPGGRA